MLVLVEHAWFSTCNGLLKGSKCGFSKKKGYENVFVEKKNTKKQASRETTMCSNMVINSYSFWENEI